VNRRLRERISSAVPFRVEIRKGSRCTLHDNSFQRTDCNSPVHTYQGRVVAFVSHYLPIGHTYRRVGERGLIFTSPLEPVRIEADPDPSAGKWIESIWRDSSGKLYGWYHAEILAHCAKRLFIPHIGSLHSNDDGLTWHLDDVLLRAPVDLFDCSYQNGFLAGGYGDFSVIPDRTQTYFYLHFSSYVPLEQSQGIAVARYPIEARDNPAPTVEIWSEGMWRKGGGHLPTPFFPVIRGWSHKDPDAFWGPAVHYNRDLQTFVMLVNHTQHGEGDIRQEGIYCSFNKDPADPEGWSPPICIVKGGGWYPQVVGLGPEDGDTISGAAARFFMTGFSEWEIRFTRSTSRQPTPPEINWFSILEHFSCGPHGAEPPIVPQQRQQP